MEQTLMARPKEQAIAGQVYGQAQQAVVLVQAQLARQYPRDEQTALAAIKQACGRLQLAEDAEYRWEINARDGKKTVEGPTIYLLKEISRHYGNLVHGWEIVSDNGERVQVRGYAWDLETNHRHAVDASIALLVKRDGQWRAPDARERDAVIKSAGSKVERVALETVLPSYMVDEAVATARNTIKNYRMAQPGKLENKLVTAFAAVGVMPEMIRRDLDYDVTRLSEEQLGVLRTIYAEMKNGMSWESAIPALEPVVETTKKLLQPSGVSLPGSDPAPVQGDNEETKRRVGRPLGSGKKKSVVLAEKLQSAPALPSMSASPASGLPFLPETATGPVAEDSAREPDSSDDKAGVGRFPYWVDFCRWIAAALRAVTDTDEDYQHLSQEFGLRDLSMLQTRVEMATATMKIYERLQVLCPTAVVLEAINRTKAFPPPEKS